MSEPEEYAEFRCVHSPTEKSNRESSLHVGHTIFWQLFACYWADKAHTHYSYNTAAADADDREPPQESNADRSTNIEPKKSHNYIR